MSAFLTSGTAATSDAAASDRTMGCPGGIGAAVAIKVHLNKIKRNNITMGRWCLMTQNVGHKEFRIKLEMKKPGQRKKQEKIRKRKCFFEVPTLGCICVHVLGSSAASANKQTNRFFKHK